MNEGWHVPDSRNSASADVPAVISLKHSLTQLGLGIFVSKFIQENNLNFIEKCNVDKSYSLLLTTQSKTSVGSSTPISP